VLKESTIVYHHPEHQGEPYDIKGKKLEGDCGPAMSKPINCHFANLCASLAKFKGSLAQ